MQSIVSRIFPLCLSLGFGLVLGAGCHNDGEEVSPRARSLDLSEGRAISVELPAGIEREQIHAVATHVESGLGADVAAAKVKVEKRDAEGAATMVVELWGTNLPDEATLSTSLKSKFDFLANSSISVAVLDAEAGPTPAQAHSDAEDPEVARQEIIDQLHEQGVEGEIAVEVSDGPDGRRIEVQVEDHQGDDAP